jgi:phosphoglycerate dehydrogenase-like enzyme
MYRFEDSLFNMLDSLIFCRMKVDGKIDLNPSANPLFNFHADGIHQAYEFVQQSGIQMNKSNWCFANITTALGGTMDNRKIVINLDLEEVYLKKIKEAAPDFEVVAGKDLDELQFQLKQAEIILRWKKRFEPIVLKHNEKLRWVQNWSAGVNNLPMDELEKREVTATSANGVHAYPISETIFAHILGLTRKLHTYIRQQQVKKWNSADLKLEIHEKTIGIIGVGAIGRETAKIAKAFGMRVLGMRYSGIMIDNVDRMYRPGQLNELLPQCDYVVITLPLTKETTGLFTKEHFRQMKETAFIINIGRGPIIAEEDLIEALQNNEIAGAGLDVFATEPLPEDSLLWGMDNVIITPHTAGATEHYTKRVVEDIFIPNLKRYVQGEAPNLNVVNYTRGY